METRLPRALELLRGGDAWIKGNYHRNEGYCLLGAIRTSWQWMEVDEEVWEDPKKVWEVRITGEMEDEEAVIEIIKEQYPSLFCKEEWIPMFNDDLARTFPEIERVVEKAILKRSEALD